MAEWVYVWTSGGATAQPVYLRRAEQYWGASLDDLEKAARFPSKQAALDAGRELHGKFHDEGLLDGSTRAERVDEPELSFR